MAVSLTYEDLLSISRDHRCVFFKKDLSSYVVQTDCLKTFLILLEILETVDNVEINFINDRK